MVPSPALDSRRVHSWQDPCLAISCDRAVEKPFAAGRAFVTSNTCAVLERPSTASFRVESLLGEGAAGAVYRVRRDGIVYAMKVPLARPVTDPQMISRLLLEGNILRRFDHPNIVRVYEIGNDPGFPYLLCEYVDGEPLSCVVDRSGAIPWERAFDLCLGVLAGLEVVHQQNIVHRDIKPANILLAANGTPKLADFGIAKAASMGDHTTMDGVILGSPAYMAPEILRGRPATPRSDVYSSAVVLFEMISGATPHPGSCSAEWMMTRLRNPAPALSSRVANVPKSFDALLAIALTNEPSKRFPTAAAFRHAIQETRSRYAREQVRLRLRSTHRTVGGSCPSGPSTTAKLASHRFEHAVETGTRTVVRLPIKPKSGENPNESRALLRTVQLAAILIMGTLLFRILGFDVTAVGLAVGIALLLIRDFWGEGGLALAYLAVVTGVVLNFLR